MKNLKSSLRSTTVTKGSCMRMWALSRLMTVKVLPYPVGAKTAKWLAFVGPVKKSTLARVFCRVRTTQVGRSPPFHGATVGKKSAAVVSVASNRNGPRCPLKGISENHWKRLWKSCLTSPAPGTLAHALTADSLARRSSSALSAISTSVRPTR